MSAAEGRVTQRRCLMKHLLGAQVTEVSIFEEVIFVSVHICEDLKNDISLKTEFQLITDIGEVREGHLTSCAYIKCPESARYLHKLVENAP